MKKSVFALIIVMTIPFFSSDNATGKNLEPGFEADTTRPRVIISSDFPPVDVIPGGSGYGPDEKRSDPDDVQSMVRFLLYTNEFDVEGLIASAGTLAYIANKQNILDILNLYDQVDEKLRRHDSWYPTPDYLRSVTWEGRDKTYGRSAEEILGDGMDSEASNSIIKIVDQPDPRPVWVCVWGGPREVAQAIWTVRETRSHAELERFLSKLRIYLIGKQDGSAQWLLDNFPKLFVICSDHNFNGMIWNAAGSDTTLANVTWTNAHIRKGHGPLGAVYPKSGWDPKSPGQKEGDSPSFLYLISAVRGLNNPENPTEPSWGGKFIRPDSTRNHWFDDPAGPKTVYRWRSQVQNDFAALADWCVKSYAEANHPPVVEQAHALDQTAEPGETVQLSARGTHDPDGDQLDYRWWQYREADSYAGSIEIQDADNREASFTIPADACKGDTIHIICEVTDGGSPPLTRYKRVNVDVQ